MITTSNKLSRLASIAKRLDSSALEQIKKDALNLATDSGSYGCTIGADFICLLFSKKEQTFVCKTSKDINSRSKFFQDGTSKKDNLVMLSKFFSLEIIKGLNELVIKSKIDYVVDNFLIETVNLYLLELQKALDSFHDTQDFQTIYKFVIDEVSLPFDFFTDEELQVLLEKNLFSNLFVCRYNDRMILSTKTINRLSIISNKLLNEFLDGLKIVSPRKDRISDFDFGYRGFIVFLYRIKELGYITNKDFFDKLKTLFVQDEIVWSDFDFFYENSNLVYSKISFDFKVDSEEDAKSLAELVEVAVVSYFSKGQKLFKSSREIIKELLGSIKNSDQVAEDFRIFGLPKKSLGINSLNSFFDL